MALPSTGKTPPARAKENASTVGGGATRSAGSAGTSTAISDGGSRAAIRRSRVSTRAVSRANASRSSITSTHVEAGKEYESNVVRETFCAKHRAPNLMRRCGVGDRARILLRPWWQELHQHPQNRQRQKSQHDGDQQSLARNQAHLVGRVSQETLGKQLAPDHDVPAHGKNTDQGQASGHRVNAFAGH